MALVAYGMVWYGRPWQPRYESKHGEGLGVASNQSMGKVRSGADASSWSRLGLGLGSE